MSFCIGGLRGNHVDLVEDKDHWLLQIVSDMRVERGWEVHQRVPRVHDHHGDVDALQQPP